MRNMIQCLNSQRYKKEEKALTDKIHSFTRFKLKTDLYQD